MNRYYGLFGYSRRQNSYDKIEVHLIATFSTIKQIADYMGYKGDRLTIIIGQDNNISKMLNNAIFHKNSILNEYVGYGFSDTPKYRKHKIHNPIRDGW